ncbi:hypothetical protein C8R44DRAFT_924029 [Mycena epipterygia]|nr:hypothetical protein C8R44DRAFT_924029 [Mycena epipterygia]
MEWTAVETVMSDRPKQEHVEIMSSRATLELISTSGRINSDLGSAMKRDEEKGARSVTRNGISIFLQSTSAQAATCASGDGMHDLHAVPVVSRASARPDKTHPLPLLNSNDATSARIGSVTRLLVVELREPERARGRRRGGERSWSRIRREPTIQRKFRRAPREKRTPNAQAARYRYHVAKRGGAARVSAESAAPQPRCGEPAGFGFRLGRRCGFGDPARRVREAWFLNMRAPNTRPVERRHRRRGIGTQCRQTRMQRREKGYTSVETCWVQRTGVNDRAVEFVDKGGFDGGMRMMRAVSSDASAGCGKDGRDRRHGEAGKTREGREKGLRGRAASWPGST